MTTELLVALALLAGTALPVAYSFQSERRLARACYEQAVAMEIVDGEIEFLLAADPTTLQPGEHEVTATAAAARNLPDGRFIATISADRIRVEWQPAERHHGGPVIREVIRP